MLRREDRPHLPRRLPRIFWALMLALALGTPRGARAQADTEDEDEAATKHFSKGSELYTQGKYPEAIVELEKAFALRPAPPILLNIGRTYEKLKQPKKALHYYQTYLLKARLVDPNRKLVEQMVQRLEKELGIKSTVKTDLDTPDVKRAGAVPRRKKKDPTLQLVHTPVDAGKVRKPVTLQAELPPDLAVDGVYVYFRKGGDRGFRRLKMRGQGEGYLAVIPGEFITSTSLQYYLQAEKKGAGKKGVVATAGTRSTPHIVVIEGGRAPHLGPARQAEIRSPYRTWFWVAAAGSAAILGGSLATLLLAKDRESALETRVGQACNPQNIPGRTCPPSVPTRRFDQASARDFEAQGKTFSTMAGVFLGVGIAALGATGVLWYLDRDYVKRERRKRLRDARAPGPRLVRFSGAPWATPSGGGFVGRIDF